MEYITKDQRKIEFTTILEQKEKATRFRHFKGKMYQIVTIAKDSEDLCDYVVYQGEYGNHPCWIRKIEDFFSLVDPNKYPDVDQKERFQRMD